jgi:excisionase family DNA binding protein
VQNVHPNSSSPHEAFVTAKEAAEFLKYSPITVKRLARQGRIPAHSVQNGIRKRWRFLLSELAEGMQSEVSLTPTSAPLTQGGSGK